MMILTVLVTTLVTVSVDFAVVKVDKLQVPVVLVLVLVVVRVRVVTVVVPVMDPMVVVRVLVESVMVVKGHEVMVRVESMTIELTSSVKDTTLSTLPTTES